MGSICEAFGLYEATKNGKPLEFIRNGRDYDGGYVVPVFALEQADAVLGYGICDDPSFEVDFSNRYNKPSYGFDCGVSEAKSDTKLFTFISECIGTDKSLYKDQKSSGKISSFDEQLKRFELENKKLFIKMDIEGGEFEAMPDILNHTQNITGIGIEVHISNPESLNKAIDLLGLFNKNFVLVHVHGNNFGSMAYSNKSIGGVPQAILLSYINKNLVDDYKIAKSQKHPKALDMPCNRSAPDCTFEIKTE